MFKIPSALLLALLPSALLAQSSVWKVSKGDQSLYIGGTCHMLRTSDYPLPPEFDIAYAASQELFFEIDPAVAEDPAFGMQLLAAAMYSDGRTLESVLSPEAYTALEKQCQASGLPIQVLNGLKPGMAVMMLTVHELTKVGVSQEGVDVHYNKRAIKDGKRTGSLETPEFQIELLTSMGEGMESDLVLYSLQDLKHIQTIFDQLIATWRSGDLNRIEALFISDMRQYPDLYAKLLVDRNKRWIPQLEAMLKTPEIEFVLFGAAHAAGKDGVLQRLQQRGYQVEAVAAP